MKKTIVTFIVCSLMTYVLSFACAFIGFIGPVFWVGIGVPAAFLCAFPMIYLLSRNPIPGQLLLTSVLYVLINLAIGEIWKPLNIVVMLVAGVLGELVITINNRNTNKGMCLGYSVFSIIFTASIVPLWFYTEEYLAHASEEMNSITYADGLNNLATPVVLVILLVLVVAAAILGTIIAEKVVINCHHFFLMPYIKQEILKRWS